MVIIEIIIKRFNGNDLTNIIEWLFDNINGRFIIQGNSRFYFENSEDAVAFKLRWL